MESGCFDLKALWRKPERIWLIVLLKKAHCLTQEAFYGVKRTIMVRAFNLISCENILSARPVQPLIKIYRKL